jgi:hypothetical protein
LGYASTGHAAAAHRFVTLEAVAAVQTHPGGSF